MRICLVSAAALVVATLIACGPGPSPSGANTVGSASARFGTSPGEDEDASAQVDTVELRPIDQDDDPGWTHAHDKDGTDNHFGAVARNDDKNRDWVAPAGDIPDLTFEQLLAKFAGFDHDLGLGPDTSRSTLEGQQAKLDALEKDEAQVVSVTGYLVDGYAGGREACNYRSAKYHDWHLELFAADSDHPPTAGSPTPVICETTRFTEDKLYESGIRLQNILHFTRTGGNGDIAFQPTGHAAHKVRVTGYLLWDDEHNATGKDIGPTVIQAEPGRYYQPWRQTAWEVHPILKIEDLDAKK